MHLSHVKARPREMGAGYLRRLTISAMIPKKKAKQPTMTTGMPGGIAHRCRTQYVTSPITKMTTPASHKYQGIDSGESMRGSGGDGVLG